MAGSFGGWCSPADRWWWLTSSCWTARPRHLLSTAAAAGDCRSASRAATLHRQQQRLPGALASYIPGERDDGGCANPRQFAALPSAVCGSPFGGGGYRRRWRVLWRATLIYDPPAEGSHPIFQGHLIPSFRGISGSVDQSFRLSGSVDHPPSPVRRATAAAGPPPTPPLWPRGPEGRTV